MISAALTVPGIVLPSLFVAWCVRRWFGGLSWREVLLLLALAFVFTGPAIVTNDVPVPLDEVMRGYPYRGVFGEVQPRNPLTNDTVKQMLPWMDAVRREFSDGRVPLWNPWAFSGYPLLGNGQSAPFAPAFLLTIFVPLPKQLVAMAGFKIFVAMLFTFLVARREGVSTGAAITAAVLFGYSVFQNVYLYYPLTSVTSLFPAAIFALGVRWQSHRLRGFVLLTIITAATLAGGHPESAIHIAIGCLIMLAIDRPRGAFLGIAAAVIAGALLSAPAWLPLIEQASESIRADEIRDRGRAMTPEFPHLSAWALLHADAFGNPARGNWSWILNYSMVAPNYIGLLPLACIAAALFARGATRRDRLLAALCVILFLLAMNWTPLAHFVNGIPPFSMIANDRLRFLLVFFAAIVTARVVDNLRVFLLPAAIAAAAIAIAAIYLYTAKAGVTIPRFALTGVLTLSAIMFRRHTAWIAAALVALDLWAINAVFNAPVSTRYYAPRLPILDEIHKRRGTEPFRILGHDWIFLPNASAHYELEDIRGSDPMGPAAYARFFKLIEIDDPSVDVKRVQNVNQPGLDFLNVRYLLTEPQHEPGGAWVERYRGADGRLYENTRALPRFFAPHVAEPARGALLEQLRDIHDFRDRVVVSDMALPFANPSSCEVRVSTNSVSATSFEVTITTCAETLIASSQPNIRGWRVRIGDREIPLHTINGAFIGFVAPRGTSRAIIEYKPLTFTITVWLFAIGLLALIAGTAAFHRAGSRTRTRRSVPAPPSS